MSATVSQQPDSYEDLSQCRLDGEQEQKLLREQRECTFMWTNEKGEAFGVIMSFLAKDGRLWLTCAESAPGYPPFAGFPELRSASRVRERRWERGRP